MTRMVTRPQMGKTPEIFNETLTVANTEYSVELGDGTVVAEIHARSAHDIRVSFVTGAVGGAVPTGPFWTIKADASLLLKNVKMIDNRTLYLASTNAGTVVEIFTWRI